MMQDATTYYVWIGGSCDYGHKERAGGAAVVIEYGGGIISRDVISDLHTTEFRMMLTLMVKVMNELPERSDILFLTNAAYIQNFDKEPTSKSANSDLIVQCIDSKRRHNSVNVKIVQYHKSPLLLETHDISTMAMKKLRQQYNRQNKKERRANVPLCMMTLVMGLITSCSGNSNQTASMISHERKSDTTAHELQATLPEDAEKPAQSIWDKLANDMVLVENDTNSFYICKYEVTQKLWEEVMGENPSQMQGDELPVEQVNWDDCQAFITKLNRLTGKNYRLPTETEWEFACRGGKYSKGYKYSGSNDIDEVAWYSDNSEDKSHPVGQKQPNELGLYDMSGNVWEWCQDMHDAEGMCRGGSWIHNARNCDPSQPNETPQKFKINCLGLRLAL